MGVVNREGALYFATGIDNTGMRKDADETLRIVDSITSGVKRAGIAMGAVFGASTLAGFANEIVKVRGEVQMLESSFETLLGSRLKADQMIAEIKEFAVESPLSLTGVSNAAQLLLSFNVEAEKTIPIIRQIGDISMGNEQRFQSLALAFAQMSSIGKLMGQDLNQMINAGFNPLQEISRTTGKSISELRAEMESGAISAKMVEDAFESATAQGGKFYEMTKKQAEGIQGLKAQLGGALQDMYNEIGKDSEKLIAGVYKGAKSIVESYETIGRVLTSLIATYGAYKAAVVTVTVAEKGWTMAQVVQYKWLVLVEKAQKLLNATMLKNPYVAAATAIVGLITLLWSLRDKTDSAQKAQERLNKTLEEAKEKKEALKNKGSELISVLQSETATVYQQVKAYEALLALLPQLQGKSLDEVKAISSSDLEKMLSTQSQTVEIEQIEKEYQVKLRSIETIKKKIKELEKQEGRGADLSYYRKLLSDTKKDASNLKKELEDIARVQKQAFYNENPQAHKSDLTEQKIKLLEKQKELQNRINNSSSDMESYNDRLQLSAVKSNIEKINIELGNLNRTTEESVSKNKEYWENIKKQAEDARAKLDVSEKGSEEWNKHTEVIKNATVELEKYSDKVKESTDTTRQQHELMQGIIDAQLSLEGARISILQDGKNKRLQLSAQEWKEEKAKLDKEFSERVQKYKELKQSMPEEEKALFEDRHKATDASKKKRDSDIEKTYQDEYISRLKTITDVMLTEEGKRREASKQRYDNERKWANEQLAGGSITQEQFVSYATQIDESEQKEQHERLLSSINDFKQQELNIIEKWDALIADSANDEEMNSRLIEGKQKALSELNSQMLMQSDEWVRLFDNMDTLTASEIQKLIDTIKSKVGELKLDPINLDVVLKNLDRAKGEVAKKNPFLALSNSIKEYKKAEKGAAKSDALKGVAQGASASLGMVEDIFGSVVDGLTKMGLAGDEETQKLLGNIGEMVGGAAQLAEGIASGNPAAIVAGGIKLITSAIEVFDSRSRKANRTIKSNQERIDKLKVAYEDLERAVSKTYSTKAAALLEEEQRNLQAQKRLVAEQKRAEQSKKKPDKDAMKEYDALMKDIDNRIEEAKDRQIEALAGTDVMSAIDQFAQAYADAWASGEKSAARSAEVVKGILRNALVNYMKGEIQTEVDEVMRRIADAMKDGTIDEAEQKAIDALVGALDSKAEQYQSALNPYLDKDKGSGVTGELKAAMTEGTASQLVGLWNMTAMDIRMIKEYIMSRSEGEKSNISTQLREILDATYQIRDNTRSTADNTGEMNEKISELNSLLEEIKRNTKPNNSRI